MTRPASCGHEEYLHSQCKYKGCYNAYETVVPHEPPEPQEFRALDDLPRRRGAKRTSAKRTGHDALRDLADCPASLQALAAVGRQGGSVKFPRGPVEDDTLTIDDLERWSTAVAEILDFPRWRAHLVLASALATGALAGAAAVMVVTL